MQGPKLGSTWDKLTDIQYVRNSRSVKLEKWGFFVLLVIQLRRISEKPSVSKYCGMWFKTASIICWDSHKHAQTWIHKWTHKQIKHTFHLESPLGESMKSSLRNIEWTGQDFPSEWVVLPASNTVMQDYTSAAQRMFIVLRMLTST